MVVDGVTVAPVWAGNPRAVADVVPHAFETLDAACTRLVETPGFGALAPWLGRQTSALETRPPAPPTTFSRIFELHPTQLESLPDWWQQSARDGSVVIARRLALRAPRPTDAGVWSMPASLHHPLRMKPIRMELSLWRHMGGWTKLVLEPARRVYVKALYFDTGHRALDALCTRLCHELVRACPRVELAAGAAEI